METWKKSHKKGPFPSCVCEALGEENVYTNEALEDELYLIDGFLDIVGTAHSNLRRELHMPRNMRLKVRKTLNISILTVTIAPILSLRLKEREV